MSLPHYEYVIIGQGIAGSCVAWELWRRRKSFLLLDAGETATTSRVAAGLITPVTGQRLVPSWRFHEFRDCALPFYREVEAATGSSFYRDFTMLRIFQTEREAQLFRKKQDELKSFLNDSDSPVIMDGAKIAASWGCFEMPQAGQLRTAAFLDATREFFTSENRFLQACVDIDSEFAWLKSETCSAGCWQSQRYGLTAGSLICCQGIEGRKSDGLKSLPWKPAKGEILTVRIPNLNESRILNSGVWLIPVGGDDYRTGSTYEWNDLDQRPTPTGRDEIVERLKRFLKLPFEIIDQQAAVRPSMEDQKPFTGILSSDSRLAVLNGLGSKGALMAPLLARQLIDHLEYGADLDPAIDVQRRFKQDGKLMRLTERAHQILLPVLEPGDIVIDATAGNGVDTQFLAEQVGSEGRVFAFDIQQEAIDQTALRLMNSDLSQVTLFCASHAEMFEYVPPEYHGSIKAVMFNLGYLPGGDKNFITKTDTTLIALDQASELLAPGGVMTIVLYPGHPGGDDEAEAVDYWCRKLDDDEYVTETITVESPAAPRLLVVRRANEA